MIVYRKFNCQNHLGLTSRPSIRKILGIWFQIANGLLKNVFKKSLNWNCLVRRHDVKIHNFKCIPCHGITHNLIASFVCLTWLLNHWRVYGEVMENMFNDKGILRGENRWLGQSHRSLWLWSIGFGAKGFSNFDVFQGWI